jgi:hypothetical protein
MIDQKNMTSLGSKVRYKKRSERDHKEKDNEIKSRIFPAKEFLLLKHTKTPKNMAMIAVGIWEKYKSCGAF